MNSYSSEFLARERISDMKREARADQLGPEAEPAPPSRRRPQLSAVARFVRSALRRKQRAARASL